MPNESAKLKNKMITAMIVLLGTTITFILLSSYFVNSVSKQNYKIVNEAAKRNKKLREAQVAFRMEVQEWKNILLRSHNQVLGERYRKQFTEAQTNVNKWLSELMTESQDPKFLKLLKDLQKHHEDISSEYKKALNYFDENGLESATKVDADVRGIDREFNSLIDNLIVENEKLEGEALEEAEKGISSTILSCAFIFGTLEILLIFIVQRYGTNLLKIAQESEFEALKNKENLRITLDSIGDAVIATDVEGKVTTMNPVAVTLTGWKLEEARGKPLLEVFNIINALTREKAENPFNKVMATGQIVGLANHTALLSKDGHEYQIADSGAPIHDINQNIVGVVLVFRDVTKEYELRDRLNHSQKMDAIGQLAGGVAHDFNNMLGAILGAADVLGRKLEDDKSKKFHGIIVNCAERASNLVDKLLSFARKQPESSTKIDLHEVLFDTLAILKNTLDKRIHLKLENDASKSMVIGDPSQLQSIFINLGINASHAMKEGGKITISTTVVHMDEKDCEMNSFQIFPGDFIQVEFRDTGTGIPKELLSKIFEPFFTTKELGQGTGLGLSAVLGTVQQHQGSISVYSEEGKGTSFHILLPLAANGAVESKSETVRKEGSGRILVIDDEVAMLATAQAILEDLGYEVELAEDGQMGLDIFKANSEMFDLVLLDMIMPKMNGRDCFFELKKVRNDIKIVLTSGFTLEKDLHDIKEAGLDGFVKKPYRSASLSEIVHKILNE